MDSELGERPWTYEIRVELSNGTGYHGQAQYLPWSINPPAASPFQLTELTEPLPPVESVEDPFYVDLVAYEAHLLSFLEYLADGVYGSAAGLVTSDGHDLDVEMWADAIENGHVDAGADLEAQFGQWCEVAECTAPAQIVVLLGERANGTGLIEYDAFVSWPGDLSSTFEFHVDNGVLGIIGIPPLRPS